LDEYYDELGGDNDNELENEHYTASCPVIGRVGGCERKEIRRIGGE